MSSMVQKTVKIEKRILDHLEVLLRTKKDDFGLPLYRSRSAIVTEALKRFLREQGVQIERQDRGHKPRGRSLAKLEERCSEALGGERP
ncbi:MAG: hypothetical protein QXQ76_03120 [Candidatus Bathyarchaeia archaeon]